MPGGSAQSSCPLLGRMMRVGTDNPRKARYASTVVRALVSMRRSPCEHTRSMTDRQGYFGGVNCTACNKPVTIETNCPTVAAQEKNRVRNPDDRFNRKSFVRSSLLAARFANHCQFNFLDFSKTRVDKFLCGREIICTRAVTPSSEWSKNEIVLTSGRAACRGDAISKTT